MILLCHFPIDLQSAFINNVRSLQICLISKEEENISGIGKISRLSVFDNANNEKRTAIPSKITNHSLRSFYNGVKSSIITSGRKTIASCDLTKYYNKHNLKKSDIENNNIANKIGTRKEQIFNTQIFEKINTLKDNPAFLNDGKINLFQNLQLSHIDPLSLYNTSESKEQFPRMVGIDINKSTQLLTNNINLERKDIIDLKSGNNEKRIINIIPELIDVDISKNYIIDINFNLSKSRYISSNFGKKMVINAIDSKGLVVDQKYFNLNLLPHLKINNLLIAKARMSYSNGTIGYQKNKNQKNIKYTTYRKFLNYTKNETFKKIFNCNVSGKNTQIIEKKFINNADFQKLNMNKSILRSTISMEGIDFANCVFDKIKGYENFDNISSIPFYVKNDTKCPVLNIYVDQISDLVLGIIPYKRKIMGSITIDDKMELVNVIKEKNNLIVNSMILIDDKRDLSCYKVKDQNFVFNETYEYYFDVILKDGRRVRSKNTFIETAAPRENILTNIVKNRNFDIEKNNFKSSTINNDKVELKASFILAQDFIDNLYEEISDSSKKLFDNEFKEIKQVIDSLVYAKIEKFYPEINETKHIGYVKLTKKDIVANLNKNSLMGKSVKSSAYLYDLYYVDKKPRYDSEVNQTNIFNIFIYKVTPIVLPIGYYLNILKNALITNQNKRLKTFDPARIIKENFDLTKNSKLISKKSFKEYSINKTQNMIIKNNQTSLSELDKIFDQNTIPGDVMYFEFMSNFKNKKNNSIFKPNNFTSSYNAIPLTPNSESSIKFKRCAFVLNFNLSCTFHYDHFVVYTSIGDRICIDAMCHISKNHQTNNAQSINQNVFVEKIIPENLKQLTFYIGSIDMEVGKMVTKKLGTVFF